LVAALNTWFHPGRYHDEEVRVENGARAIGTGLEASREPRLAIEPETAGVASFGQAPPDTMQYSFDREE